MKTRKNLLKELSKQNLTIGFNRTCLKEKFQSKYTYILPLLKIMELSHLKDVHLVFLFSSK